MKLSCTNTMVPGDTLTQKALNLKKWGFDAISLQIPTQWSCDRLTEEILSLREKTGLAVCEFSYIGAYFGRQMSNDTHISKAALADQKASIDMCARLGAGNAIGYEYAPRNPLPLFEAPASMPEELERKFVGILNDVGRYAAERGVELSVEGINRYETRYANRLSEIRGYLEKTLPELGIGILADFFHMAMEERSIPDAILENNGYLRHVHLGENNRMLPGYGALDWRAGFRALKEAGYDGYLALECAVPGDPYVQLPECAEFLKKCLATC